MLVVINIHSLLIIIHLVTQLLSLMLFPIVVMQVLTRPITVTPLATPHPMTVILAIMNGLVIKHRVVLIRHDSKCSVDTTPPPRDIQCPVVMTVREILSLTILKSNGNIQTYPATRLKMYRPAMTQHVTRIMATGVTHHTLPPSTILLHPCIHLRLPLLCLLLLQIIGHSLLCGRLLNPFG